MKKLPVYLQTSIVESQKAFERAYQSLNLTLHYLDNLGFSEKDLENVTEIIKNNGMNNKDIIVYLESKFNQKEKELN